MQENAAASEDIVKKVGAALECEPRINVHQHPIRVRLVDGAVMLEGEVGSIAAKKLALRAAGSIDGVRGAVDRLRVKPAEPRGDGAVRDSLTSFLLSEPELAECIIRAQVKGKRETLRDAAEANGEIRFGVEDGVVTLEGSVISLSHKRLVGVLAWWSPGCQEVINSLAIVPGEDDNDEEVVEALSLVLEIDPLVHAEQIKVSCRNYNVTLLGYVGTEEERRQAELDAWALFGVRDVINRIEVGS